MLNVITKSDKIEALKAKGRAGMFFSNTLLIGLTFLIFGLNIAHAHLTATGQIRERTEARGGFGTELKSSFEYWLHWLQIQNIYFFARCKGMGTRCFNK